VKRPKLDRYGPIRNWSSAVSPTPDTTVKDSTSGNGASVDAEDPVVRGVVEGGRVVEDWIRQAQRAARLFGGTAPMGQWTDAGGQLFRAMSDAAAAWWSLVGVPPNGFGSPPRPSAVNHEAASWTSRAAQEPMQSESRPNSRAAAENTESSPGPRLRIELASRQPVEVTVDLHKRAVTQFRVLDLRAAEGEAPRIPGTRLESWDANGLRLKLTIPDDQPPGTYHGVVLDPAADCVVGTVTLRIPTA
jgi:hypothetical protein